MGEYAGGGQKLSRVLTKIEDKYLPLLSNIEQIQPEERFIVNPNPSPVSFLYIGHF